MKLEIDVRLALVHAGGEQPTDRQAVLDDLLDNLIQSFEAADYDFGHNLWSVSVVATRLVHHND